MIAPILLGCALALAPGATTTEAASSVEAAVATPRLALSAQVEETLTALPEVRAASVRSRLSGLQGEPHPAEAVEIEGELLELEWPDLGLWIAYRPGDEVIAVEEIGTLDSLLGVTAVLVETRSGEVEPRTEPGTEAGTEAETTSAAATRFGWRPPVGTQEGRRLKEPMREPVVRYWKTTLLVDAISIPLGLSLFAAPMVHWLRFDRPGAALSSLALRAALSLGGGGVGALFGLGPAVVGIAAGMLVAMVLDWIFLSRYARRSFYSTPRRVLRPDLARRSTRTVPGKVPGT